MHSQKSNKIRILFGFINNCKIANFLFCTTSFMLTLALFKMYT